MNQTNASSSDDRRTGGRADGRTVRPSVRLSPSGWWVRWMVGAVLLGAVIALALHLSEGREFLRIAERARPRWLVVAVLLQSLTYLSEGQVWRGVARAARFSLSVGTAYTLSLTKLFVDQVLPSAGLSGTTVVARSLEERGMPRPAVMALVVVVSASYHFTYVVCLAAALTISLLHHQASPLLEPVVLMFAVFAMTLAIVLLTLSGRAPSKASDRVRKTGFLRRLLKLVEEADPRLARDPRLILRAAVYQLCIFLLDASTIWVLIEALGTDVPMPSVFASYMIATVFRTLGVLPGGLGTFEATSVITLKLIGVDLAVALSATLLFRGFSFWLPMLPGLWFFRRISARGQDPGSRP